MKKFILFGVLMLSACTPTAVDLPTTTLTKPPAFILSHTETPTSIFISTSTLTPTLESISGGWSIFHSPEYRFSFLYPAVYDEGFDDPTISPRFCNIHTEQKDGGLHIRVGLIQINIQETSLSLQDFVNDQIAKNWSGGWQVEAKKITADNILGIRLDAIDNNMTRWVATTYFLHDNSAIAIQHYENSFMGCDPMGTNYSLYWVYEQIIKTLKFD